MEGFAGFAIFAIHDSKRHVVVDGARPQADLDLARSEAGDFDGGVRGGLDAE